MAKKRSIKVISQSGHNYKATPTIMLKGKWLKELGFDIGDYVSITCENGKLIITPDAERAAIAEAEAAFMEREMEALKKKFICDLAEKYHILEIAVDRCLRNQGEPQGSVYDERGLLVF